MPVTTIMTKKEGGLPSFLIYILGIIGVGLVVFFGGQVIENIGNLGRKAGINVNTINGKASVSIDGQKVGDTPYTANNLKPGTKTIILKNDSRQYQTSLNFIPSENGTLHVVGIIHDLGTSEVFSSGLEFWFEKDNSGNPLRIISEPTGATVSIDGSEVGKTPFSSNNVTGGNYELKISYPNYETQTSSITVQKGYTLNGKIKLFPYPLPPQPKVFEGSPGLYDLSLDNADATADTQSWVKGVIYWNTTRKTGLSFDYYLDYKGNLFDREGKPVIVTDFSKMGELKTGGYLGKTSDGPGLTAEAKQTFLALSGKVIVGGSTATVLPTPTEWLRVRDSASLNGNEISRVDTGGQYTVLDKATGWVKIKVSDTITGWVSADYVKLSK